MRKTRIIEPKRLAFRKSEATKIEFLNQTITGKFVKWEGDRPFDVFLQIEQYYDNFMENLKEGLEQKKISLKTFNCYCHAYDKCDGVISFNDQFIRSINGKPFKHFVQ